MFATRGRYLITMIAATLLTSGAFLAMPSAAAAAESDSLHSLANQSRWANGLDGLLRNAAMDQVAIAWAETMAANGTLSHNPDYSSQVPSGWTRVGENVAQGHTSATAMHEGWMSSTGHRANILGDYTDVGLAFIESGGTTWGVQVFAKYAGHAGPSAPGATTPTPEPTSDPSPSPAPSPSPDASPTPDPSPSPVASPDPVASPAPAPSPQPTKSSSPLPATKAPGGNSTSAAPATRSPASAAAAKAMQVPMVKERELATLPFSPLEDERAKPEPKPKRPGTTSAALAVPGSAASGKGELTAAVYSDPGDGLLPLGTGLAVVLAAVAALLASRRTLFPQGRHRG